MTLARSAPVAIIGGGFSGTMLAAQLARRGIGSLLIDGSGRIGCGTAYSTTEPAHLLNIPAGRMSAWPDRPDDFARLFEAHGGTSEDFAERCLYGSYLTGVLDEAIAGGHVRTADAEALEVKREEGTWQVALGDGSRAESDSLVLAIGNQSPGPPQSFAGAGDRFIANPWGPAAAKAVSELAASGGDAFILGTGLTMVDLALSLEAAGHGGRILALSRRGLLPRSSVAGPGPTLEVSLDELPLGDLGALARWLRRRGGEAGWREAVNSLRPHSHAIWASLDLAGRRRFMRHARAWWDVHRHRLAPQVAAAMARMIGDGRLEIKAGRIASVEPFEGGLKIAYRSRGSDNVRNISAAFAFNCTGPLHAMSDSRNPLLRSLLDSGAAQPDPLDISLAVDERARVIGSDRLWALGALTKGRYWEIIAVPDISVQVAAVAENIAMELGQ